MALRDMEYDRPRLEEREIAFFVGRNLTERMKHTMRGFLHLTEREKSNVVRLAHFFKCPANAHVTRQSSAAIGRLFKSSDGGNHRNAPSDCITLRGRSSSTRADMKPHILFGGDNVDPVKHSLTYYAELQKAGVPVEMHLYAQGGHAIGLIPTKLPIGHWPALAEQWLHTIGVL